MQMVKQIFIRKEFSITLCSFKMELVQQRERLPIFRVKKEIQAAVLENKASIFVGEPGCGKTTQIPQYLLEAGFATHKCIAITQPRRVAAITIARRVADEVGTKLGNKVGYSIRFENVSSAATKIKFLTDGMLLRESIYDTLLLEYSVVILDEIHERTLHNDLLLGIVKNAQFKREKRNLLPLKIIAMSATIDAAHISGYFNNAPYYTIHGRDYTISIMNPSQPQDNYIDSALISVFQIHRTHDAGDILVFCTGQEEIDYMVSETNKLAPLLPAGAGKVHACGLYSALPQDQQADVFKPLPQGIRKVIFATNIAETSITIPNIKFVVDTGMVKARGYNSAGGFDVLRIQRVSKAQAEQRAGRAGREFDGFCYRLYTTEEYKNFKDQTEPEILRCSLSSAILQMVAMGIKRVSEFDFIDKPSNENIAAAINMLTILEAVVDNDGALELTECGKQMSLFPLDPRFSKIIISSKKYKCTDEILTIIAMLSVESVFYAKSSEREEFNKVKDNFSPSAGDHIVLLNVYKEFKKCKGNLAWCKENFIHIRNVRRAMAIRKQLSAFCIKSGINPCSCHNISTVKTCLITGFFMNIAMRVENNDYFKTINGNERVRVHPSSGLHGNKDLNCCYYTELVQTSQLYMRNVTPVVDEVLYKVVPNYFKDKRKFFFRKKFHHASFSSNFHN